MAGDAGYPKVRVPASALTGSVLEDYMVLRDPAGGKPVTIPPGGAQAPYRSWILDHPAKIELGPHTYGHVRAPQAIVARASVGDGPGQVAFHLPRPGEVGFGPSSFDVARDGTVWVADRANKRLLAYAPGTPGRLIRTVTVPSAPLELSVAPRGTVYVLTGSLYHSWDPRMVYAFGPDGTRLWAVPATGEIFNPVMIADANGVPWIHSEEGWIPVTDRSGHPLTVAQQIRQTVAYEPLSVGRQLVDTGLWPYEERIGLATTTGTLLHTWRITSSDNFQSLWPQAVIGADVVDMGGIGKQNGSHYTMEFLVVRISPAGRVLDQCSLDASLSYNWGDFTRVRVGQDGKLYYLQTSPDWGMRVARYTLRGAPAAPASPTPTPPSASAPPSTSSASPAPSTSHSTAALAPVTPPAPPSGSGGGLTARQWLGVSLGIATIAALAAAAVLAWRRRRTGGIRWPRRTGHAS